MNNKNEIQTQAFDNIIPKGISPNDLQKNALIITDPKMHLNNARQNALHNATTRNQIK